MKYEAIIYDLDGTILNTFDMNIYPLIRIVKEELGKEMSYKDLTFCFSLPGYKCLEALGIKDVPAVHKRWVKYVNEYEHGAKIYHGFDTVIHQMDGEVVQAIVSSKKREQYAIDVESKNLHEYFSTVVLYEDTKNHKPDAEPLLYCANLLGVAPNKCLYVGDSLSDFEAARSAGMDFALASWGSFTPEKFVNPAYTLKQPEDLLNLVD